MPKGNDKRWYGPTPNYCGLCGAPIKEEFYDAKTWQGPWSILCPDCFDRVAYGLGPGRGQHYSWNEEQKLFLQVRS